MSPDNGKLEDLFGPPISIYLDSDAFEDGLFDVKKYSGHGVNRVTANVYAWLGGFMNGDRFANQYRELEEAALEAYYGSRDKELVSFDHKGQRFWLIENAFGVKTIMFPDDF
jgi:hypothetical protein